MAANPSFLSRSVPTPGWLTRFWGTGYEQIPRIGAIVGLMEGMAIARYDVAMNDVSFPSLLQAVLFIAANTILSVAIWSLLGWLVRRVITQPGWAFRCVFFTWAISVAFGRHLLGDRTIELGWWMWWCGCALVFLVPLAREGKFWTYAARGSEIAAALLVTSSSLMGRVPDYSFLPAETRWLLGTSAVAAVAVYTAAIRMQVLLGVFTVMLLAIGLIPVTPMSAGDTPNVLFVLVDTLRRDHVSVYGGEVESPAIEALAEQSVTFQNAVTVIPKTTASVSAIYTGRYPKNNGVRTLYDRLRASQPTLAETFFDGGYRTAAFVNNAWLSRGRGFAQGFERFYGYHEIYDTYGPFRYNSWVTLVDRLTLQNTAPFNGQTSSARLTDAALRYIESRKHEPFLAYVHYFEPHWPYFPPDELAERYDAPENGQSVVNFTERVGLDRGLMIFQNYLPEKENEGARRLYKGEADNTLAQVGRLIQGLDELGLEKDTIVVFTADHGHSLGEHEYFFHHGEFLYDPSTRIPLILRWTGRLPAGAVVEQQARSIDLAPTLYTLAGVQPRFEMDGEALTRYIADPEARSSDAFLESDVKMFPANLKRGLTGVPGKIRALRTDRHKLILNPTHKGAVFELYDLELDPGESNDLADDPTHASILSALKKRLLAEIPAQEGGMLLRMGSTIELDMSQPELDENETEMLRTLGYIQ